MKTILFNVYETAGGPADRSDVILAGKFDNGPVRYYRASLKNSKGEKLAFKRNYLYTLNLVRVEGGGYSTMMRRLLLLRVVAEFFAMLRW